MLYGTGVLLKELKKGDVFRVSEKNNGKVYIRGDYIRSDKKYECNEYFDYNNYHYFKGNKKAFVGFTF